jgi:hypothetical protein
MNGWEKPVSSGDYALGVNRFWVYGAPQGTTFACEFTIRKILLRKYMPKKDRKIVHRALMARSWQLSSYAMGISVHDIPMVFSDKSSKIM